MSFTAVIIGLGIAFGLITVGLPLAKSLAKLAVLTFSRAGLVVLAVLVATTVALFLKGML